MPVRPVRTSDADDLCRIYQPYVLNTAVTFIYHEPTPDTFTEKVRALTPQYPFLVYEEEGTVMGYAYASSLRPHEAYQWDVELSVYVDEKVHGRGIGRALYSSLLRILTLQGYRNAYAVLAMPNEKSLALHQSFGFESLGLFPNSGYKLGKWHDILWLCKPLGSFSDTPVPPVPFAEIAKETVDSALKNA